MRTFYLIITIIAVSASLLSCKSTPTINSKKTVNIKDYFDTSGRVFIKLYKNNEKDTIYWETWNEDDKNATVHWGELGTLGEHTIVTAPAHTELREKINTQIAEKLNEGYTEIPLDSQYTVALTFKLATWGTTDDLDRREEIRNILTEHLGWTGNGRCDDGDIGSGEMTLYADVVNPYLAIKTIPVEFKRTGVIESYYFTIMQGDSIIADKVKPQ